MYVLHTASDYKYTASSEMYVQHTAIIIVV